MLLLLFLLYSCVNLLSTTAKRGKIVKKTRRRGKQHGNLNKPKGGTGIHAPSMPSGVKQAAGGARTGYKGAKKGAKVTRKGCGGGQKGLRAGIQAVKEAKRARSWAKMREKKTGVVDWSWKEREPTGIEEDCGILPIEAMTLPRVDMSFARPQLARRSRLFNERLRKDWRYLIDDEGNKNFQPGRYGATFLMPVGWPPTK